MAYSIRSNGNHNTDIRASALIAPIHAAEYLARRLFEVGIRAVHGVPGDHNLASLDYLEHCGLSWVGNCNELNAGYAADGYARIKGISALFTSFGVGELSALNAIAGAYTEFVPVIHVVGTPPTYSQRNGLQLHNPLGNGNASTFTDMSRQLSCAVVALSDPADIPDQIDHAIRECWVQSRPVYIALPADMVQQQVEGDRLRTPIDLSYPPNDPDKEDYVVDVVLRYMQAARNAIILVDACAIRHRALLETHDLVERSQLPTFVSPMGKGAVNEALPNYCGVYAGDGSDDEVRERVETADLVLSIGVMKNDFATPGFSYRVSELSTIDFHSNLVRVKYSEYPDLRMNGVIRKIVDRLPQLHIVPGPTPSNNIPFHRRDNREELTHSWFWRHMARWLQPNDIVITETGTPNYGIWEARFPPNVTAINQVLWNSAGYATAATQGAALAAQELMSLRPNRRLRTILFTGDGTFQLTAQEISTMIRKNLTPIIFIISNDGATSERLLHHRPTETSSHNADIRWRYKDLIPALGAEKGTYQSAAVSTRKQVQALFADASFNEAKCLQFVELRMAKDDAPVGLRAGAVPLQIAPSYSAASSSREPSPMPSTLMRNGSASTYGTRSTEAT